MDFARKALDLVQRQVGNPRLTADPTGGSGLALDPFGSIPVAASHVITGLVDSAGNTAAGSGSGFTSTKLGTGDYRITFNTPLATNPCVIVQPFFPGTQIGAAIFAISTSSIRIKTFNTSTLAVADSAFFFIAQPFV